MTKGVSGANQRRLARHGLVIEDFWQRIVVLENLIARWIAMGPDKK